jgi:D-alanine-D-alanine ligase
MNKFNTNEFLRSQGIHVPQSFLVEQNNWTTNQQNVIDAIHRSLPFPLIVKPHDDGCSVMVQKVTMPQELICAIETIFAQKKEHALVEECIAGMELTVGVIGNETVQALPPSYTVSTADVLSITEKFLPGAGENQTPAPLPPHALKLVQKTMETVYKAVGCSGYARIDCFYQTAEQSPTHEERVVILEINTLPGLTPATCIFHQAAEINLKPMDFIDLIVQLGMQKHKKSVILENKHQAQTIKNTLP